MLDKLLGSLNKERVLIYVVARERGYAREIARFFDAPLNPVQKALDSLERAGVLMSSEIGTTRQYEFNPRYALRTELRSLLVKALELYPDGLRAKLKVSRSRPRRKGKPL